MILGGRHGRRLKGVWVKEHGHVGEAVERQRQDVGEGLTTVEVESGVYDSTEKSSGGCAGRVDIEGGQGLWVDVPCMPHEMTKERPGPGAWPEGLGRLG